MIFSGVTTGLQMKAKTKYEEFALKVQNQEEKLKWEIGTLFNDFMRIKYLVDEKDPSGETKLHKASKSGLVEEVEMLLELGADANIKNKNHETCLHLATKNGFPEVAEILLQNGAEVNAQNRDKLTPLHFASWNGNDAIAEILLQHGANVNAKTGEGQDPFGRHFDPLDYLEFRGNCKSTPLHFASEKGHFQVVKLLLQYNADIFARNIDRKTPLRLAGTHWTFHNCGVFNSKWG